MFNARTIFGRIAGFFRRVAGLGNDRRDSTATTLYDVYTSPGTDPTGIHHPSRRRGA